MISEQNDNSSSKSGRVFRYRRRPRSDIVKRLEDVSEIEPAVFLHSNYGLTLDENDSVIAWANQWGRANNATQRLKNHRPYWDGKHVCFESDNTSYLDIDLSLVLSKTEYGIFTSCELKKNTKQEQCFFNLPYFKLDYQINDGINHIVSFIYKAGKAITRFDGMPIGNKYCRTANARTKTYIGSGGIGCYLDANIRSIAIYSGEIAEQDILFIESEMLADIK